MLVTDLGQHAADGLLGRSIQGFHGRAKWVHRGATNLHNQISARQSKGGVFARNDLGQKRRNGVLTRGFQSSLSDHPLTQGASQHLYSFLDALGVSGHLQTSQLNTGHQFTRDDFQRINPCSPLQCGVQTIAVELRAVHDGSEIGSGSRVQKLLGVSRRQVRPGDVGVVDELLKQRGSILSTSGARPPSQDSKTKGKQGRTGTGGMHLWNSSIDPPQTGRMKGKSYWTHPPAANGEGQTA